jgi:flagellar basal body rod protein FlgF
MSQHDYNLADQAGAAFRADLNDALAAIVSQNSGATAPATTFAYQLWADTAEGRLKQRNAANGAWLDRGPLSAAFGTLDVALNTARATVVSHATDSDIWNAAGNEIDFTGTATVTDFPDAPQAGASRILHCAAACTFTNNANIAVQGAANYTAAAGDIVTVHAITTSTFRIEIAKANGTAVAQTSSLAPPQLAADHDFHLNFF